MNSIHELCDVLVVGSINVDLVIRSPRLPKPGETVLDGEYYQAPGGKGANQAVAAALTTAGRVGLIASVGDDSFGASAIASLRQSGVDVTHVRQVEGTATGVALILVDHSGQNLISVASGANLELTPARIRSVTDDGFASRVLLCCLESPLDAIAQSLARAREFGTLTILNPAPAIPAILSREVISLVDILTPNESELALLTGRATNSDEEVVAAAGLLLREGPQNIIVTRGSRGATLVSTAGVTHFPPFPVDAVDATAAGDAFNGALASQLAAGTDLPGACRWASAAAAISVTRKGAQPSLPARDEVESFLARLPR